MSRSTWKFVIKNFSAYQSRSNLIVPQLIQKKIKVHNGKMFKEITINNNLIGYKCGEFIFTKLIPKYKKDDKK